MSRRLKQAVVVLFVVFAAAQLVRPERANPATDLGRKIQAHVGTSTGKMPGAYTLLHPETRLSPQDVETIAAAREAEAEAAGR